MKVLFDHQVFSYQAQGGVSRYFAELIRGLDSRGHQALRGWRWSPNRYLPGPDLLGKVSFKGKAHLRAWVNARVSDRCLKQPFDLFHPTYYDPYFLARLKAHPFVLTIHDMTHELYPNGLSDATIVPARKRALAHHAARVIAVSQNTKDDAVRILGLDPTKVTVIAHGNSLSPQSVTPEPPNIQQPYWLYVGTRHGYKDFSVAVKALAERSIGTRGERLVLIGGGALSPPEQSLLAEHGLEGLWSHVTCSEAQLAGWYGSALGLVYPSRYEGFGLPLIEAMAWGCPVVAARASSLPEVGANAALYFEPGDFRGLVEQLARLDDPTTRASLVSAGIARSALFTWETTVEQTLKVYREALA